MDSDMVTDLLTVKSQGGKLPHGWRTGQLDELVDLNPEQLTSEYPLTRIAYLDISNVSKGQVKETVEMPLSEAPSRAKRIVRAGDTLLSTVRPGNRAYAYFRSPPDNLVCSTGFAVLRARRESTDGRFAYYLASSDPIIEHLATIAEKQTAYPSVNPCDIGECLVPIPPLPEQRAIARVLGSLDDKIDLNRRMNQTLEEICRALFKFWFVDFGPVRAKAEGRWKKGESLPGMPADMWDLWPSEFEESEIGEIPKGWRTEPLSETARFLNGIACQRYPAEDGFGIPVLKIAELRRGNTLGADRASPSLPSDYLVQDGDLIFSWSGSLEVKFWYGGQAVLNQHLFKVTSKRFPLWLCFHWILGHLESFRRIAAGKATTMGHIQRHHLDDALAVVPPRDLVAVCDRTIGHFLSEVKVGEEQSGTLAKLRDALLPKLLSGEIRVKVDA